MYMFTSYGHIIKLKENHRFFDDFTPGHVPLNIHFIPNNWFDLIETTMVALSNVRVNLIISVVEILCISIIKCYLGIKQVYYVLLA